jgi:hypothetical protein
MLKMLPFLALLSVGCATVDADLKAVTADVKACVDTNAPAAIQLVERNAGPALYDAFMCDADAGFSPNAIPACLENALAVETSGMGQYAEAFKMCVVTKVETDPNIKPLAKQRAHLVKAKIAAERAARGGR